MRYNVLKRWGFQSFVFLLLMLLMVGCGAQNQEQTSKAGNTNKNNAVAKEEGKQFPVTITDDVDRKVTIDEKPQSIVSLQASNTEILFALGLGDHIVGVSEYCNYPPEAEKIQQVGAQDMDAELILSLLPDVAFVTDYHYQNHADILKKFEEAGIKVIVTGSASSFTDVYRTIDMMADATGTAIEAEELISDMKERLAALKEKAKSIEDKKRVWVEVSPGPDIFTTGKNTFMHEMLESIQAVNVAEDQDGWVKMTEEEIVELKPEAIITTYGYYVDHPEKEVLSRDGWAEVPAVKNEQVFDVENDTVNRPGPRLIEGVETLAKLIYPETFK